MTLPHTAAEYAEMAERSAKWKDPGEGFRVGESQAQVLATLALAAKVGELATATLEAARLMGPTPEDQRRLDELMPKPSAYCSHEWTDDEAEIKRFRGSDLADNSRVHRPGAVHRCNHAPGHEKEEPHYCLCGSEL